MKIGIIGTRGIPNKYGGFEQFAQYLSEGLVEAGMQVSVYSSHDHPYREKTWNNVELLHVYNPETKTGTWGQFIYDLLCIIDSRKRNFDVILQLGYTSSSVWHRFLPRKSVIVTNMDGLEWKRTKYSKKVQKFLLYAEKLAVKSSDHLIADSKGIQRYLNQKYKTDSVYLPYGTYIFNSPDQEILSRFKLQPFSYNMLIARLEPENSIDVILEGVVNSASANTFIVIGNYKNKFGEYLKEKYKGEKRIVFYGPEYDLEVLNNLRYYARMYFHGHTVGGTNPSLLEAMGSHALICAHDNEFNRYITGEDGFYFDSSKQVSNSLDENIDAQKRLQKVNANLRKVETLYLWPRLINDYEKFFRSVVKT